MVKVSMPPVPVVVPVWIMTCNDVIAKAGKALIRLPCDFRTRRLCTGATHLTLCVRWVPKRGEPGSRALKVRNTIWHAHSAKADATSTAANSMCDLSATMQPTCLEAATPVETTTAGPCTSTSASGVPATAATKTTTTESSSTAAVASCPCCGTQRHECDASYQTDCLSDFHTPHSIAPCFVTMARLRDFVVALEMC